MKTYILAEKYVRAFKDSVQPEQQANAFANLIPITDGILANEMFWKALKGPTQTTEEKSALIRAVIGAVQADKIIENFFLLLIKKNRIALLPACKNYMQQMHDQILNQIDVEVCLPELPSSDIQNEFKVLFKTLTVKKMNIQFIKEETMLGGFKAKMGHQFYDGSIRNTLRKIGEAFRGDD